MFCLKIQDFKPNGREMKNMIIAIVWIVSLICIFIMNKIKPDILVGYAIYVIVICVAFTVFAVYRLYLR
nr:MAG TPA: hypothetical protein [Caudoviricetes sp.]